jgi:hypothetical protein
MSGAGSAPWSLEGQEFVHCNRAYTREGEPIHAHPEGLSRAVAGLYIERGRYGDTELSGLSLALVAEWQGSPAQDGGRALPIIDDTASDEQRTALLAVMGELAAAPVPTFLRVFPSRFDTVLDPVFAFIGLAIDVEGRRALLKVPGFIDARGEPILDLETGEPIRPAHGLPGDAKAAEIELGRGWATATGPIAFETRGTHAQFARLKKSGGPAPAVG